LCEQTITALLLLDCAARPALAQPIRVDVEILSRQRMSLCAGLAAMSMRMIAVGNHLKVIWVDAQCLPARVVYVLIWR
jgi:hypothetical protein